MKPPFMLESSSIIFMFESRNEDEEKYMVEFKRIKINRRSYWIPCVNGYCFDKIGRTPKQTDARIYIKRWWKEKGQHLLAS